MWWMMAKRMGACLATVVLGISVAEARQVTLDAALDSPVLLEGGARRAYVRVALKGYEMTGTRRTPANLAIVLDRSGSMAGPKLAEARRAAVMAVDRLGGDDIVSVVVYDDTARVLVPASKLSDADAIRQAIMNVESGGSTALFAGVSKGARELRKFLSRERVNRVILLSDGIANVGPSSPGELAELGSSLAREGMAVTTVGLGLDYNETLMTRLAAASDGNHFFAERAEDLARVFETELGEVLSVIAQDVDVTIRFERGVRPVRVLGREAEVRGATVVGRLNQLYARQTKYFVIEVQVPAGRKGQELLLGDVSVSYADMASGAPSRLAERVSCRYSDRQADVDAARNPVVVASVARQIGAERNRQAITLRDEGKIEEARRVLVENAAYLEAQAKDTKNKHLAEDARQNQEAAGKLDENEWKRQRKQMEEDNVVQQRALGYVE